jgi:two-component system OmpR family response regulator
MSIDESQYRILVVDDEASIRDFIESSLKFRKFQVRTASSGTEALVAVEEYKPHAILLDVMMPGMDGFEVCQTIRNSGNQVGILFLTAKDEMQDKVKGLMIGADDYMTKPFGLEEIAARVHALLRRVGIIEQQINHEKISYADLELDDAVHEVRRAGNLIELSPTEFTLLRYLMENADRVVSKAQILDYVWDYDFGGDAGIVETYISYLRKKIDVYEPPLIHTVRGVGYRLRIAPAK